MTQSLHADYHSLKTVLCFPTVMRFLGRAPSSRNCHHIKKDLDMIPKISRELKDLQV